MASLQLIEQTIASNEFEEAFYMVDINDMIEKHHRWMEKMPRVKPFYAVKCNDTPIILETLSALNIGFDCASKVEIKAVLSIGVSPKKIIYANPCKMKSYIEYAIKKGVDLMTFDSEEELYKIADCAPEARLVLRIKVDDSKSKYHLGKKFGASMTQVLNLLKIGKDLNLNIVGVSFHVGSECESCKPYVTSIEDAAQVFTMAKEMGFKMNILDIGGGFPGNTGEKDEKLFTEIAKTVNDSISANFPTEWDVEIIAEPGRFYVVSAFTLTTIIIGKRKDFIEDQETIMYYIADGLWGSFANVRVCNDKMVPIPHFTHNSGENREEFNSIILGQTCETFDTFGYFLRLPEMKIGDWVTFEDMGAYTLVLYARYCGFQAPLLKYHISEKAKDYLKQSPNWKKIINITNLNDSLNKQ